MIVNILDWEAFGRHGRALVEAALAEDSGFAEEREIIEAGKRLDVHQVLTLTLKVCWKYYGGHDKDAPRGAEITQYFCQEDPVTKTKPLKGVCAVFNQSFMHFFAVYAEMYGQAGILDRYAVLPVPLVASLELSPLRNVHLRRVEITHEALVLVSSEGFTPIDPYHSGGGVLKDFSIYRLPDAISVVYLYEDMGVISPMDLVFDHEDQVQAVINGYEVLFKALDQEDNLLSSVGLLIAALRFQETMRNRGDNARRYIINNQKYIDEYAISPRFSELATFLEVTVVNEVSTDRVLELEAAVRANQTKVDAEIGDAEWTPFSSLILEIQHRADAARRLINAQSLLDQRTVIEATMREQMERVITGLIEQIAVASEGRLDQQTVLALIALTYLTDWSLAVGYPLDSISIDVSSVVAVVSKITSIYQVPMFLVVMKRIDTLQGDIENAPEWVKLFYASLKELGGKLDF